jgi:hypothetical protein
VTAVPPARTPPLPVLITVAIVGGLSFGILQETQDMSILFWAFVAIAMALAAASAVIRPGNDAKFLTALKTVPLLILAVLALTLGDFAAYALEIDGRDVQQYNDGVAMSWPSKLAATLLIGAIYGTLLGLVAAMTAWMLRRAIVQARTA